MKSIQNRAGKCADLPLWTLSEFSGSAPRGGGTWVIFGWVCAARDSKLTPRSKKISPKIDTPF